MNLGYRWPFRDSPKRWMTFPEIAVLPGRVIVAFEWREDGCHKIDFAAKLEWHGVPL